MWSFAVVHIDVPEAHVRDKNDPVVGRDVRREHHHVFGVKVWAWFGVASFGVVRGK